MNTCIRMKFFALSIALGLLLGAPVFAADTVQDAVALHKNNATDAEIMAWAFKQSPIEPNLENFKAVTQANLSSDVIRALIMGNTAKAELAPAAKPAARAVAAAPAPIPISAQDTAERTAAALPAAVPLAVQFAAPAALAPPHVVATAISGEDGCDNTYVLYNDRAHSAAREDRSGGYFSRSSEGSRYSGGSGYSGNGRR